jgi:hypothetical protein
VETSRQKQIHAASRDRDLCTANHVISSHPLREVERMMRHDIFTFAAGTFENRARSFSSCWRLMRPILPGERARSVHARNSNFGVVIERLEIGIDKTLVAIELAQEAFQRTAVQSALRIPGGPPDKTRKTRRHAD